jgi:hypothetical protein
MHHAVPRTCSPAPPCCAAPATCTALRSSGPAGQIGTGLGQTTRPGTISLIAPTIDITHTGQTLTIDGVEIVFQMTPGTEAPAEMNFYFPQHRALCTAENTSHTLHNVLTIRGAVVRDATRGRTTSPRRSRCSGDELDVVFASHHWPTWGRERAVEFLAMQRDMYLYLHDQTLRMINQGYTGAEIAELLETPPALGRAVAHPRLLRLGEPQRQGDLPALHGLVRRQPGQPVAAPARGGRGALRGRDGRPRRCARRGPPGVGRRRLPVVRRARQAPGVRRRHRHRGAPPARRRARAARLRRRERHLAQRLPRRGHRAPVGQLRHTGHHVARHGLRAQRVAGLRQHRRARRRAARVGRAPRDRLDDHRRGHHLRRRAPQRRAPPPHRRRGADVTTFTLARRSSASSPARSTSAAALGDGTVHGRR